MTNMLGMAKICHLTLSAPLHGFLVLLFSIKQPMGSRRLNQKKTFKVLKEYNDSEKIRIEQIYEIESCSPYSNIQMD